MGGRSFFWKLSDGWVLEGHPGERGLGGAGDGLPSLVLYRVVGDDPHRCSERLTPSDSGFSEKLAAVFAATERERIDAR